MKTSSETAPHPETFVLAGKDEHGAWQKIEIASVEDGESADDVKVFLQTLAQASTRTHTELEIMTEAEFAARMGTSGKIAA